MTDDAATAAIVAALQAGDPGEAERLCRGMLHQQPDDPALLVLLALSRWRQDQHAEAVEIYARLAHTHPDDGVHWSNYATAALMADDDAHAQDALRRLTQRIAPEDPEWHHQHGLLHLRHDRPREARDAMLRAFAYAPDSPAIRIHAARACAVCRDMRADGLVEPWRTWLPLDDTLQFELADLLALLGETGSAVELLEELEERSPGQLPVRLLLADWYERVNRVGDAEAMLDRVTRSGIADPAVGLRVTRLQAQLAARRGDYDTARRLLEARESLTDAAATTNDAHWFALAKACDKLGDVAATMHALAAGHAAQIDALQRVQSHLLEPDAEILPNQSELVPAADYAGWPILRAPDATQSPIFVVGFPRSGTTLLEQMLDSHPQLQSMDERPFFNVLAGQLAHSAGIEVPRDLGKLSQRDCDELRKGYLVMACGKVPRRWDARLVDKNPLNMMWLPLIHRMYPHAKFIFALRHPCDVILSCYMQNFRAPVLAVAGRSLEQLARTYVAAMQNWLYHVELFKPDVFVSRYEDLVADTPAQTGRIAEFLGIEEASAMMDFAARAREKGYIKTPSYTQVIQPINTQGVGRWLRYREYFAAALPILQPMLVHWHYPAVPDAPAAGG